MSNLISRRELLKRASIAGAAAVIPVDLHRSIDSSRPLAVAQTVAAREPFEHLTAMESDVLDAIVARIIPSDAHGPGAREARAARYIDRALGGALAASRPLYAVGDRKSTRLNSSHEWISYAVFCLKKKKNT